ncbi:hypothetical protein, partial [Luteimonas sp. gir]|uniref:hypothetical protein n=1 Tax=Luteimonas sp. gir TaxID=3127960 RepID=UPI003075C41D
PAVTRARAIHGALDAASGRQSAADIVRKLASIEARAPTARMVYRLGQPTLLYCSVNFSKVRWSARHVSGKAHSRPWWIETAQRCSAKHLAY